LERLDAETRLLVRKSGFVAFGTKLAAIEAMPNPALDSFVAALFAKVVPIGILAAIFGSVLARQARRLLHPRKRAFKCG
jgi:hypothetical protein